MIETKRHNLLDPCKKDPESIIDVSFSCDIHVSGNMYSNSYSKVFESIS